jgi:16S rRNA (guanine(966)-N(2))-methyltransferase RsmD
VPDAGRVIAGRARGRRLAAPGEGTRPLADRVKETLFAILEPELPGATFLDLFAGSGAAGIEALSRGAAKVVFVDRDRTACTVIEVNLRSTGLAGPAAVVRRSDALAYLDGAAAGDGPFEVVVLDPPYTEAGLLGAALERLGAAGLVAPGGRVVAKRFRRTAIRAAIGLLASDRERRFGETTLTFYRRIAAAAVDAGPDAEEG